MSSPWRGRSLTDLLDEWRRVLPSLGGQAVVDQLGPPASPSLVARMEEALGFEFNDEVKEFMAWGTAKEGGAWGFLPVCGPHCLLSPKQIVASSRSMCDMGWRDLHAGGPMGPGGNGRLLVPFAADQELVVDLNPGPTFGGVWNRDDTQDWGARNLAGVIEGCLRLAEAGLVTPHPTLHVTVDSRRHLEFSTELTARLRAGAPSEHPIHRQVNGLGRHLYFRWEVLDDLERLLTSDRHWVW